MYTRLNSNYGYRSSVGVLPPLQIHFEKPVDMKNQDEVTKDAIAKIQDYIKLIAHYDETGIGFGSWPAALSQLTKDQAFTVLRNIHQQCNITGAIHLPDLKALIFQCKDNTYSLRYEQDPDYRQLYIKFNFDNGFSNSNNGYTYQNDVTNILQDYFLTWKSNGRQGFVIPVTEQKLEPESDSSANFDKSGSEHLTIHAFFSKRAVDAKDHSSCIPDNKIRHSF